MNQPNNRNRRVTDKPGGILDAAEQALRLEKLSSQHDLLAQRVAHGMENVAHTMSSVQVEVRGLTHKIGDLAGLQYSHDTNKGAIDEVKKSLGDLNTRLEEWFDDFDQRSQRRWEQYEKNRDQWRREHEAENENTKRDLEKEIRSVRETVIRFIGFGSALGALAGVIIGGFLWNINYRFNEVKEDLSERTVASSYNRSLFDKVNAELVDIKLYLARGGRIPVEPYVPPTQRNTNGNEQPQDRIRQPAE